MDRFCSILRRGYEVEGLDNPPDDMDFSLSKLLKPSINTAIYRDQERY